MSDSTHLKARNLLADAFAAHGLGSAITNSVRLPGRGMTEEAKAALEVIEALLVERDKAVTSAERADRAYGERNALAVAFTKAALAAGWKAGQGIDNDPEKDWGPEWRHVVYVQLPDGQQVSWHMAPAQLALLQGLPEFDGQWDGTFVARDLRWALFEAPSRPLPDRAVLEARSVLYEQLRKVIDGGSESMTHSDALALVTAWALDAEEVVLSPGDVDVREYPRVHPGDHRMRHGGLPKGVEVTCLKHNAVIICDSERSQHLNRTLALVGLRAMIKHKEGQ